MVFKLNHYIACPLWIGYHDGYRLILFSS